MAADGDPSTDVESEEISAPKSAASDSDAEEEEELERKADEEEEDEDEDDSDSDYYSDYSDGAEGGGGPGSEGQRRDENSREATVRQFADVLESKSMQKRFEEEEKEYVYHEDLFDFPRDPERWREEDLMELWADAPVDMTKPGWDPIWADEEDWEVVQEERKAGRDPPIAPFYVPYRKHLPAIPDNHHDISNPKSVIEELDRIEEFLKWVSYIFPDGSSYEGTVWDDLAHGKGVYVASQGLVRYEGEWLQNAMEGHGVVEVEVPSVEPVPGSRLEAKMRAEGRIIARDFMSPEDKQWMEMDIEDSVALAGNRVEVPFYEKDEWIKLFGSKPEKGRYKYAGQWKHGRMHGCGVYEVNEQIIYGRFYFGDYVDDSSGCDADVSGLHAGIAEVAAAKARMFVNKPDGMVRASSKLSTAHLLPSPPRVVAMCGILAVLCCSDDSQAKRVRVLELSRRLKHRGPDWSGLAQHGDCFLSHQRLAIIDPASGDQPLYNGDGSVIVTVNGEIYNHEELRKSLPKHTFRTGSDCDVIAHLYEEHGENFIDMLDGIFSFVLLDTRNNTFLAARDAIGVTPLYIGWGLDGSVWISSEMKGLNDDCEHFEVFPPGHLYSSKEHGFRRWYNPPWFSESIPSVPYDPLVLRKAFEDAVIKRLMTDVPFGVLLSGGLDSSLVASVTARHLAGSKAAEQWGTQLHSFCVGLEGSPDLKAGKEVAEYLGTVHHEFTFTVQDGIDAIEDVIYHIESYDVTTIRASTPMFLMSRKIKSLGVKMVISGEGSDEIFGGYLYFHKAPNKEEFHRETCRKIKALHQYDCLRANKATSAWGLEARVPFLDKEFINTAMSIDPEWKMINPDLGRMEKWILRRAFDDEEKPYLPKHILYRQKEQFSDGVGYSWIDGLKAHAADHVTDRMMLNAKKIYPHNTPTTKEAYYYRMIFERFFPQNSAKLTVPGGPSVACSTATAMAWDEQWSSNPDPSGRAALGVHLSAYDPKQAFPLAASSDEEELINKKARMVDISTAPAIAISS